MTKKILDIVIVIALPASGKSEVRKYLEHIPKETCMEEFHIGPNIQLDDFPYVHLMRRIDEELIALNESAIFFNRADQPFKNAKDWGTLIKLMNEDYNEIITHQSLNPASAAQYYLERLDKAGKLVGIPARISIFDEDIQNKLVEKLEDECLKLLDHKRELNAETLEGKTFVIEFARGGPDGSTMPLADSYGYQYSLPQFSEDILEKASILYIWVTPEEARRKNEHRADPNDPGSVLHHGVPIDVMMNDYGCDDIDWLVEHAEKPQTLTVKAYGKTFHIPFARFDNRVDKTSFLRNDPVTWKQDQIEIVHKSLKDAFDSLV